jgi:CYTH domain-containing protein
MRFLALLAILLSGSGIFLVVAWLVRRQLERLSRALTVLGIGTALLLLVLWIFEAGGWQRRTHYRQLTYALSDSTLQSFLRRGVDMDKSILMLSMASRGLAGYARISKEPAEDAKKRLAWVAQWVADERRFPVWRRSGEWEQQVFFLSHAAIILAHYQMTTLDETYAAKWTKVCKYLSDGITRSRYKNLASRPKDIALRPYDNAAALYALSLHDSYFGSKLLETATRDWSNYLNRELLFDDTALPCSGFTNTNRCRLMPVGASMALLTAYAAEAEAPISADFWREFRHYYKESVMNVWAGFRTVPQGREIPDFCDEALFPLQCGAYQTELAQWAAAKRGDRLTYYQLNNYLLIYDMFNPINEAWKEAPNKQVEALIKLSARLCAEVN